MHRPLDNKNILILGGTSGIGLAAAQACVDAGASVVVLGRDDEHAAAAGKTLAGRAAVLTEDVSQPETAARAVDHTVKTLGRLDGLYHVAGGSGRSRGDGPLHELTDEAIAYTLNLNLASVIYSSRAAVRQCLAQATPGVVINLASVLAFSPAPRLFSTHTYAAAKAGIIGFTKSAADHYAPHNIRFNVIAPGLVATPMSQRAQTDETIQRYIATKQPLDGGRIGQPDDLADAAVYLLSDAARFITGQVLAIDGGWSVTEGRAD
jgi:NAD(P)-dependent dehydrogenase (short-subunit alcohol dehydrogenase family)